MSTNILQGQVPRFCTVGVGDLILTAGGPQCWKPVGGTLIQAALPVLLKPSLALEEPFPTI